MNRYLQQRVDISVAFAVVCVNLLVVIKNCEKCSKEKCIGLITICSVLITTYIANSYEYIQYDNEDSDYSAGMMEDDEHLYCNLVNGSKDEIINDIWYRSGKIAKKKAYDGDGRNDNLYSVGCGSNEQFFYCKSV